MTIGATLLVACGDDGDKATPLSAVITESGDQVKIDMPPTVKGGVVELSLKNSGTRNHSLQFLRVAGDHTTDELVEFVASGEEGGPIPDWISEGGGIGTVAAGQTGTASFRLAPGKHFVWDDESDENDVQNATKGAVTELDVTSGNSGSLPGSDVSITAKEYEFTTKDLTAGTKKVSFENTGKQFHHVIAAPMVPGKTIDDVKDFFASQGQGGGEPPVNFDKGVGTAVVGPGNAVVATLNFEKGNYALVCFLNDRDGGAPHFTMGMLKQVTVT